MSYLTLSNEMAARLTGIIQSTELRTEDGKVLGVYVPAVSDELEKKTERGDAGFDLEQAERDLKAGLKGRPLAEIWKSLGASREPE